MGLEEIATYIVDFENKSVNDEVKSITALETLLKKQRPLYCGHVMRRENSLEKLHYDGNW